MVLPDFLTQDDGGYIHVTGHRIGLADVLFFYREGDSPEMLHARFPTITLPLVHKIIAYYLENLGEVDEYCVRQTEAASRERARANPGPSVEELKRRREAARLAQGA